MNTVTCINLTQKMRRCKNVPLNINVYRDGVMSQHCARHWNEFFGRFGALPSGIVSVVRFTSGRYDQLLYSVDRVDSAWRYAMLDSWGMTPKGRR